MEKIKIILKYIWALFLLVLLCFFILISCFFIKTAFHDDTIVWNIKVISILMPFVWSYVWYVFAKDSILDNVIKNKFPFLKEV